jgi:SPP1 gp7 family putative phage head morphogenesis protein
MLLKTPEIRRIESRFLSLFERTFLKGIKGKTAPSYPKSVNTQFKSKTFQIQADKIIDDIYLQSIKYTDEQTKKANNASVTKKSNQNKNTLNEGILYYHRLAAAVSKPLPITEEAVRQASGLAKEVTESIIRTLKDDGIYLEHPDKLEQRVRDLWGGQKYRAKRFTRTFTAEVATNTELWRYQDSGIDDLQFYAKIDEKTSDQCRALHGTVFRTDSKEARQYRPPLHFHCRSDIVPVPITQKVDPKMRFENRDFSRQMDQEFNLLDDRTDKDLIKKTFSDIDTFNEKYRIDQFILDEDLEARLQKLNIQVLSEPLKKEKNDILYSKIREAESKIKARKTEKAYLFDKNGNILIEKSGKKSQVAFSGDEIKLFRGNILTHNHPSASSLSPQDLFASCSNYINEVRATGTYRTYVMKMKNGENFYPSLWDEKISKTVYRHAADVKEEFLVNISNNEITIPEAELLHWHEVWTRTVKDISELDYSFIEEKI